MQPLFDIIHEDDDLLVINKPADLVCHPTKGDVYSSLISRIRLYLGQTGNAVGQHLSDGLGPGTNHPDPQRAGPKTGAPAEAHLINRLDRETSGVVLVAKTLPVAVELRDLWERRLVRKTYLAIVRGHVRETHSLIDAPLAKDEQSSVAIKDKVRPDGAGAQTEFWLEARFSRPEGDFSLLRVCPITGRKHQIRIHLAHYGHPIVGDKLYGEDENYYLDFVHGRLSEAQRRQLLLPNQALHAAEVSFEWRGQPRLFQAPPERWFMEFISQTP